MGRLQRKKPANKKKKKKPSDDRPVAGTSAGIAGKDKTAQLAGVAKAKKKPAVPFKKSAAAKPPKVREGHIENALQFLREVRIELKKVTWPTRSQAIGSTAVVIVLVIIISLFLGLVDGGLSSVVRMVLH